MSDNQVSTIVIESAPLVWNTKSGKGMQAASATLQALAPLAVRKAAALDVDLQSLRNGRYGRILKDCADQFTNKDIAALFKLGVGVPQGNSDKEAALKFFRPLVSIWSDAKGRRGALAATVGTWIKECDAATRTAQQAAIAEALANPAMEAQPA